MISKNIKFLRKALNISQEKLAEDLQVSKQCIYIWETKKTNPDLINLQKLSSFFKVDIDSLITKDLNRYNKF